MFEFVERKSPHVLLFYELESLDGKQHNNLDCFGVSDSFSTESRNFLQIHAKSSSYWATFSTLITRESYNLNHALADLGKLLHKLNPSIYWSSAVN